MKSYTDLEQSKKLEKILPLESADMKWYFWKEEIDAPKIPTFGYNKDAAESYKNTEAIYLACWSLASLLGILPKDYSLGNKKGKYYICMTHIKHDVIECDNPVDACYEMILKLHEQKIL